MNRRSFFRTLGLGSAAIAAQVYLPKLPDRMRWKVSREASGIYVVNPEWVNAPYEVWFAFDPAVSESDIAKVRPLVFKRGTLVDENGFKVRAIRESFPIRFNELGGFPVPAFKKLENFS